MWEFTTGCKPFADIEHDHILIYEIVDGKRPEITMDTPECYADLMKKCWDPDPSKRPSIKKICEIVDNWCQKNKQFNQAEEKRLELIKLKKLGPEFTEKHQEAVYTSRALSSLISEALSINIKQGIYYICLIIIYFLTILDDIFSNFNAKNQIMK